MTDDIQVPASELVKQVVQRDLALTDVSIRRDGLKLIPMWQLRLAHEEYSRHHSQSLERIQQRGGFSVLEVIDLLATRVKRLEVLDSLASRTKRQSL